MKNIQEILLKCGGVGKLKLGDEEFDVYVKSIQSEIEELNKYVDSKGKRHGKGGCLISVKSIECSFYKKQYLNRGEIKE